MRSPEPSRPPVPYLPAQLARQLRDPLGPIHNALHLIRQCNRDPELIRTACTLVERQVAQLGRVVDALLVPSGAPWPPVPAAAPEPADRFRRRRILIVEDFLDAAITLELLLERQGHTVEAAPDGSSGLAKARRFGPDLLLCDLGLPGELDGYQVARAMRAIPGLETLPMVALTGFTAPETLQRARQAGFSARLTKPVDPALLVALLQHL